MNNGTKYTLLIASGLGIVITLAVLYRKQVKGSIIGSNAKNSNNSKKKVNMIPNFDTYTLYDSGGKTVLGTIPEAKYGRYDVIFVWGGMRYATPSWMMNQIPKKLFYTHIIFLIDYRVNWNEFKPLYDKFMKDKHLANYVNSQSIAGFSAGGYDVYDAYNQNYRVVGLIDPSTKQSYAKLPFSANTKMVYNDRNWGGYATIKKALPIVAKAINEKGGEAEQVNLSHKEIPKYFFSKYVNYF